MATQRVKKDILCTIAALKKKIQENEFELKDLDDIRKEVDRMGNIIYNKIIEIETRDKTNIIDADVYVCALCGKEFTSKRSINSHIISHHHMRPMEDYIQRLKFPD